MPTLSPLLRPIASRPVAKSSAFLIYTDLSLCLIKQNNFWYFTLFFRALKVNRSSVGQ